MIYSCSHSDTLLSPKDEILESSTANAIICFTSKVSLIIPLAERQGLPRQCDRNTVLVREGFKGEYELTDFPSLLFVILKEG